MSTKPETKKAQQAREQEEAREQLRKIFPVGSTVSTVLRHVSRSGMSRTISIVAPSEDGGVRDVSWLVARATGDRFDRERDGIKVGGSGMDMGFALVYGLSRVLYCGGFPCTGKEHRDEQGPRCPSNDHRGEERNFTPGRMHSDPEYALAHRWV